MKQIPNIFTLCNLFLGCVAIIFITQPGLTLLSNDNGDNYIWLPEKIAWASLCIAGAAIVDFLDGFVARLFKATSEIGKQLDSLADVVSFGVAPSLMVFQFLRFSFSREEDGLDINVLALLPAFIIPCAAAYRLARFNLSENSNPAYFEGLPTPLVGFLTASFALLFEWTGTPLWLNVIENYWFWYFFIILVSYLMVSKLPMLSLKQDQKNIKGFVPFIIIAVIGLSSSIMLHWGSIPISFLVYLVVSLIFGKKYTQTNSSNK